jgi:hypothetical protein
MGQVDEAAGVKSRSLPNRATAKDPGRITNRGRVALSGIRFQPDCYPACAVFCRIFDQFVDDEAQWNTSDGPQFDVNCVDDDGLLRALLRGQHCGEIATKILEVLLECDGFYAIQIMETPVDAPDRGHAIARGGQLRSGFGVRRRPACSESRLTIICKPFNSR